MLEYASFVDRLESVLERVHAACSLCHRDPRNITVLPVTKTHPSYVVDYVYRYGLQSVGENRVQEAIQKKESVSSPIAWELIGHLQTNKLKIACQHFERIQSLDSLSLAKKMNTVACALGKKQRILLQVNISHDAAKYGILPENVEQLVEEIIKMPNLLLEGFMTIPALDNDRLVTRKYFEALRNLQQSMQDIFKVSFPVLSMGMSDDFEEAILAGSTVIRLGSILFGNR